MEFLGLDPVLLARVQFVLCVVVHFLFVPLSIGLGLFVALAETRYYKTKDPKDKAAAKFWVKIFTTTFVIGVATGITMEFSFGTNWADYSRYVGDIFGAPLAAEALLAFFLESVFLGIVLFGREKIAPKLFMVSAWLVWFGSALSALWILIANSWMQTPAGYAIAADGSKASIDKFWDAAFNPSTIARYLHTVDSVIILAAFCVIAIGAYYLLRKRNLDYGKRFIKVGLTVGIITVALMLPFAHMQATVVAETQPSKLAAMEGQYKEGVADMYLIGWVNEDTKETVGIKLPGFTSFLASWSFDTVYPGLDDTEDGMTPDELAKYDGIKADSEHLEGGLKAVDGGSNPPVNFVFQAYHLMVAFYALLIIWLVIAGLILKKANKNGEPSKLALRLLVFGPLIPFLCIQAGWIVTEVGRQPWVVYNLLTTADGVSPIVSSFELIVTIALFVVFYTVLVVAWLRIVLKMIKTGPVLDEAAQAPIAIDAPAGDAANVATSPKGGE